MRRKTIPLLIFSLILLVAINDTFSQTIIPDNSIVSGTWTLANSPYIISGRAIVQTGQTLTIEPGVEVRLESSASPTPSWFNYSSANVGVIRINGKIIAAGTTSFPILFTRKNTTGYWGAILMDETADPASVFENCIFEYSKYSRSVPGITSVVAFDAGLSFYRSSSTVQNCTFRYNNVNGVGYWECPGSVFNNNRVHDNATHGIYTYKSYIQIINNKVYNNSYGATGYVSAIFCVYSNNKIIGNLLYDNDDFGIYLSDSTNLVVNNTIVGGFQGIRVENNGNASIYNCIVSNNSNLNFATSAAGSGVINLYHSVTNSATLPTNVNNIAGNLLNTNAMFVSIPLDDYNLSPSSPCINAGKPDTAGLFLPSTDVNNNNRISGSVIDIGAFEVPSSSSVLNVASCSSYTSPSGNYIWTVSNTYVDTIPNAAGSDSLITIHLTIITVDTSISVNNVTITANNINAGVTYQWVDCSNGYAEIAGEINQSFTATANGIYAVIITENSCPDTSACTAIITVNSTEISFRDNIKVFPNPTDGIVTVDARKEFESAEFIIKDLMGREIKKGIINEKQKIQFLLEAPPGMYFIIFNFKSEIVMMKIVVE